MDVSTTNEGVACQLGQNILHVWRRPYPATSSAIGNRADFAQAQHCTATVLHNVSEQRQRRPTRSCGRPSAVSSQASAGIRGVSWMPSRRVQRKGATTIAAGSVSSPSEAAGAWQRAR